MKTLRIEILFVLVGSILCLIYVLWPTPQMMAVFVFLVQPLFLYGIARTVWMIFRDLKKKDII